MKYNKQIKQITTIKVATNKVSISILFKIKKGKINLSLCC